jgi:BirA family biotin operon repressor/biotin-[acetyl-CoA-carboxylase] ligase
MNNKDLLQKDLIRDRLNQSLFGTNIIFHKSLNSTNILAKELATKGSPEGTIVLTEEQTRAMGRMGRRWWSPGYVNLLFSILLYPNIKPDQIFVLTMTLALATIEAIKERSGLIPLIKWPNDLYVDRRKLAGILAEFSLSHGRIEYVILGLGLNVNWNPNHEADVTNPATSILQEAGLKLSRNDLLVGILRQFEDYYRDVLAGKIDDFYRRWNELSLIMGQEVEIRSAKEKIRGTAIRIDKKGALVIKDHHDTEQKIISGDVSVRF